ncbi:MAG: hypothetical protein CM1200mP16_07400 [Nitrospina sp.]|nr:MAG: hypothetical protein CM1200mP16_07400 [Nitrospina sp.]
MDTPTHVTALYSAQSLSEGSLLKKGAEIDQFRKILKQKIGEILNLN